jgi:ferric-dicitrate binding protein FerR (iron transport regulator)
MTKTESAKPVNIAPPTSSNAVLTLANGQVVVLDSAGNGTIVKQGSVDIVKLADGQIAYKGIGQNTGYNTLSNPRGSKVVSIVLSDGSKVWLNAASNIRYPVAFSGKERKVEISGEAYFEVAHNAAKPFIVQKGETEVRVLGTHFNVEAYDDESSLDVTLLEGSVSVATQKSISRPKVIRPGEQAQVRQDGNIKLASSVNLNEVMAWRDNMFSFNGADIETIMRQVSRWYNVEVVFKKPVTEKFYAEVSKNTNISTLLKMLEATKAVHFKMEGDVIVVTP